MNGKQKLILIVIVMAIAYGIFRLTSNSNKNQHEQINLNPEGQKTEEIKNEGPVNPITGISCENWNRRLVAVMQPADVQARPAAGFSQADMIFEMPAYTASVTRLMGVYGCEIPEEIGAIRSGRHDYIPLAKGLDAIYVHWGYSIFAENLLGKGVIDNVNCLTSSYCDRREATGQMRMEDTGRITQENVLKMLANSGYEQENSFSGYPHQSELAESQRPNGGNLRVAFAQPYDVEYDYDKASNTYLRSWDGQPDTDRNNNQRLAPKNVVVMFAKSEQITIDQDYTGKGLQDPWADVPEIKSTGVESVSGRYNNVEIGDPWYDDSDSGEAYFYFNGQETRGSWKKDRSKLDSKLYFYNSSGQEIKFVPGQVWVEILEPGQSLKWEPTA